MIELSPLPLEWHEVVLQPEQRRTKAARGAGDRPDEVGGYVSLGQPISMLLTPERVRDDPELVWFIQERKGISDFFVVHLGCTFTPPEEEPISWASLQVVFSRVDGLPEPLPIAWSMTPKRLIAPVDEKVGFRLGANLKFVEASIERTTSKTEEIFAEALYELEPRPGWQFVRTSTVELRGVQRMSVVVMVPSTAAVKYSIELKAAVERRKWGLVSYRADLDRSIKAEYSLSHQM